MRGLAIGTVLQPYPCYNVAENQSMVPAASVMAGNVRLSSAPGLSGHTPTSLSRRDLP